MRMARSILLLLVFPLLVTRVAVAQTAPAPDAPPASEAPPPASEAPPPPTVLPPEQQPLAGYANGSFFLRDPHDWFVLFPKGRLQIDSYNYLDRGDLPTMKDPTTGQMVPVDANGANDKRNALRNTVFVRRARAELQGTFFKHFEFQLAGEFATTLATGAYGTVADAWVNVNYFDFAQLMVGQFDAPFTMENRTSDKYFDFMERSLAVRAFSVPGNKEDGAMLWGWLPKHAAYYSVGYFNGEGQNLKSQANRGALLARAFVSPLSLIADHSRWMEDVWVGGSFWYQNAPNLGGAIAASATAGTQNDLPNMSTQGGFGFFNSSYGNGAGTRSHLSPNGDIVKWAIEANLPIKKYGLRFELVHQSIDLGEYNDNSMGRTLVANGKLDGTGYYIEAFAWILGDVNFIETPGLETPPRVKTFKAADEPKWGLMVAAKYEHVGFDITNLATPNDPGAGSYAIDAFELGINGWASKHVRLTLNYVLNQIGNGLDDKTAAQNLRGTVDTSGVRKNSNFFYQKNEHELLLRVGINL